MIATPRQVLIVCRTFQSLAWLHRRRRPYRVECTGSLLTSEVKQRRARSVLGWGTAWEDLRVLSAFSILCVIQRLLQHATTCNVLHCGVGVGVNATVAIIHSVPRGAARPAPRHRKNGEKEKSEREERMHKRKRADTIQCLIMADRISWLRTSHHSEAGNSNRRSPGSEADALFQTNQHGTMAHPTILFVSLAPRALAWLLKLKIGGGE